MANLPPKQIPVGQLAHLADPFRVLLDAPDLKPATKAQLEEAVANFKAQVLILNLQIQALNKQVQSLMAQFDWTKVRP